MADDFWAKVDRSGECWMWTARRNGGGYGIHRRQLAHRVSWELHVGAIPDGMCICHRCDTPACVNPVHLFLGTRADNNADMIAKGRYVNPIAAAKRAQTNCIHGHAFTPENTYTDPDGHRSCRECLRQGDRGRIGTPDRRASGRASYHRHRDKRVAEMRLAHAANRAARNAASRASYEKNREARVQYARAYRAAQRALRGQHG
jgi:hypothetical protein